ncbi:MAG TPA: glycosyltransferase family 4 protein [Sphingomicrobium sp.]|nr:glycosyltransferase family 4 protein [Sphingomicrobium sp.]
MRILLALPGLHRTERGAEIAFIAIASELERLGDTVTLIGSGPQLPGRPYRYIAAQSVARERFEHFPTLPMLRSDTAWEEASFLPGLLRHYKPSDYDVTLTCSFPFTNIALRRPVFGGRRPPHIFVTQNGDWPALSSKAEYRLFGCEGLVCTNPEYFDRNAGRYRSALIPNGVDVSRFTCGASEPEYFGFARNQPIIVMVSALIPSKNVADGIRAVAELENAMLVVAGDGPLRDDLHELAARLLPGRYRQLRVAADDMPRLYRSADAFLHLSRDESFGNVFIEALACGTPIVAHDLPRTRWILGDQANYVPKMEVRSIAEQLGLALREKRTGRESRAEHAKRFSWLSVAKRYRDFLTEVVAAAK